MDKKTVEALNRGADNIRVLVASMVEQANSGHPGGAMGGADFINTLYSRYIVYDPDDALWMARDRFFLDPGHMSAMLYGVLALTGRYTMDELRQFRQWGSVTPGHPELDPGRGIENASGPLGQGHVLGIGAAIAERTLVAEFGDVCAHYTYCFISDGGIQEEISQGAGRIAGTLGLNRLIMFYDSNKVQLSTTTDAVTTEDTAAKYRAWGWNVIEVDGSDCHQLSAALEVAHAEAKRPTLIIGHTTMARGVVKSEGGTLEGAVSTHGQPLSAAGADLNATIRGLGGDPENPFVVFADVERLYAERREELRKIVAGRREAEREWALQNPEKARRLADYLAGKLPSLRWEDIKLKPNMASRNASGAILGYLAEHVHNMIVSSADLAGSDKTDGFLKKTRAITSGDFGGRFLHAGVAELTMASLMNGIVLHGGLIGACATFFVFSDYVKPALRMSALMELPVKYIFTHDSFRVGEDGPTHQPVEQEAQIRLMEQLDNLHGRQSTLVLRPADSAETLQCWKMAMENTSSPTVLIFSRQNLEDLPGVRAEGVSRGGYTLLRSEHPRLILMAGGSEVALACQVAIQLRDHQGISIAVASFPSLGLFERQPKAYRDSVLPPGIPRFAITSGLESTYYPLMRGTSQWDVYGLHRFGASAPYRVLEEKFGFTEGAILEAVKKFLTTTES